MPIYLASIPESTESNYVRSRYRQWRSTRVLAETADDLGHNEERSLRENNNYDRRSVEIPKKKDAIHVIPEKKDAVHVETDEIPEKKDEYWRYIPLLKAALSGNWDAAKNIFDQDVSAKTAPITNTLQTALMVAVQSGEKAVHFVENLILSMSVEDLTRTQIYGETALHIAAYVGNTKAAEILVRKNPGLVYIRNKLEVLPLHLAALHPCKDTLLYLLRVTEHNHESKPFQNSSGVLLVNWAIAAGFYDVALNLVQRYPQLATSKDEVNQCALLCIAKKVSAFPSGSRLTFWHQIIYNCVLVKVENFIQDSNRGDLENQVGSSQVTVPKKNWAIWPRVLSKDFSIYGQKLQLMLWAVFELAVPHVKHICKQKQTHLQALQLLKCLCKKITSLNDSSAHESFAKDAIIIATSLGIHEVIKEIVESFPALIWIEDNEIQILFQLAVIGRHEKVFNLIYQIVDRKQYVEMIRDSNEDTILHLAARLAPQTKLDVVPGAALQMQHELQWFKEVEKLVWPGYIEWRNKKGETPAMVFSAEHKMLINEGQKWMKGTANSCTISAALIITVVFAAAISVPGGNYNDTGLPIFSKRNETAFLTFAVSNAISLFTATTSLLMFLSILTSRYAQEDFLYDLPKRLIIGLFTLFLSITSMVVAFSATLYLVLGHNKGWTLVPVAALASLPVTSFVSLQFPLLVDLISSTYGPGIFKKQSDRLLF